MQTPDRGVTRAFPGISDSLRQSVARDHPIAPKRDGVKSRVRSARSLADFAPSELVIWRMQIPAEERADDLRVDFHAYFLCSPFASDGSLFLFTKRHCCSVPRKRDKMLDYLGLAL